MAEQEIRKKIKSRVLDGLPEDVKSYIAGLTSEPERCVDFIKGLFLDVIRSHSAHAPQKLPVELLAAIELGLETLASVLQANQRVEVLNVLYHTFSLLLKEELLSQTLTAAKLIVALLQTVDCQSPKTAVIVSTVYVQLWNASLDIRQEGLSARQAHGVELLLLAMQVLCLKDDAVALRQCTLAAVASLLARAGPPGCGPASRPSWTCCSSSTGSPSSWASSWPSPPSGRRSPASTCLPPPPTWRASTRRISALLTFLDHVSALSQCIGDGGADRRLAAAGHASQGRLWSSCLPGTEEFACLTSCVNMVFVTLHATEQAVQAAASKRKLVATIKAILELGPFVKRHLSHLGSVKAEAHTPPTALRLLRAFLAAARAPRSGDQRGYVEGLSRPENFYPESLVKIAEQCVAEINDVVALGQSFYILAYNCFQNKLSQHTIQFAKISVELTALHMTHHPEDNSTDVQNEFWKRCELLLWEYRQQKQYTEALCIVGKLVTLGAELRSQAVVRWVKIRKEMCASNEASTSLLKQLGTNGLAKQLTAMEKLALLCFELNVSVREGLSADLCLDMLEELKEVAALVDDELGSCYVLVERTLLHWRFRYLEFRLDGTFEEISQSALSSAEAVVKTGSPGNAAIARLLHTCCLFWLYMRKVDVLREFAARNVAEAAVDPSEIKCDDPILSQALAEDKDYSCDASESYRHINVGYELSTQKLLDQILELWCAAFQGPASEWSLPFRDLVESWFFEHVKVVAEVYASSFRFLEEVKAVTLWLRVARERRLRSEEVLASSVLVQALTKLGLVDAAAAVAQQAQAAASQLDEGLPRLRFVLARAHLLYHQEKYSEGFELLAELLQHPLVQKSNKTSLLFMAEVKLLVCRYALLPRAISGLFRSSEALRTDTPITLAQEALRISQGVMRHFSDTAGTESWDPVAVWTLERVLLDSAALLGQLFTCVGAAREAYTFLKEYLRKAQVLVSATRCARLVLLIANLDLLCEKFNDAKHKLFGVEFMLHLRNFSLPELLRADDPKTGLQDDDTIADACPLARREVVSHSLAVQLFCKREMGPHLTPSVPRLDKAHDASCSCDLCQFYATRQLWIECDLFKCLLYVTVGDVGAAIGGLESLLVLVGSLQQRLAQEAAQVGSFVRHQLGRSLHCSINKSTGIWGELLCLKATVMLRLSEAHLQRGSYASALDSVNEGLRLASINDCGSRAQWQLNAHLAHHKVRLLLTTSAKGTRRLGGRGNGTLWLSNASEHAAAAFGDPAALSPPRPAQKHTAALKAPNAPRPRRDTPLDLYVKSLNNARQPTVVEKSREDKAKFTVFDESQRSVPRRALRTRAATMQADGDGPMAGRAERPPEVLRKPKKQVTWAFFRAPTPLDLTNASPYFSFFPPSRAAAAAARLDTIDEEEAAASVARSSQQEAPESIPHVQQEQVFPEEPLAACKPEAFDEMITLLNHAFELIIHFPPCPLYAEMSRTMEKHAKDHKDASLWYLSQTASVTLQHIGLTYLHRKLKKSKSAAVRDGAPAGNLSEADLSKAEALGFRLFHELKTTQLSELYELLPADWTVVHLTAVEPPAKGPNGITLTPDLFVCQCRKGRTPIMVKLSGSADDQFHRILFKEFKSILDESTATMKMTEPPIWWSVRHSLDQRMKDVLEGVENAWMGCWKGVFHGKVVDAAAYKSLRDAVGQVTAQAKKHRLECCSNRLLEAVIDSAADLSSYQLSVAVCQLFGIPSSHPCHSILTGLISSKASPDTDRHPVILILDKAVQALPWESTPILLKNSVSRVPSLSYLRAQLLHYRLLPENVYSQQVDTRKAYFILNPSNDIPRTQAHFQDTFTRQVAARGLLLALGWQGVIGKHPKKEEFQAALAGKDLIVDVIEHMLCHACPVLMGCSSGRLKTFGPKVEPFGVVLQYWIGGSPCVVANLWDVTDKDIDRFTETFLKHWVPDMGCQPHVADITAALGRGRHSCKLRYLVGAAPVVYGLPVHSRAS
ncbi:hypothetical protein HPB48_003092 [Haemaphysalis longicornis]|uniref:separase n=1 Tax=Haemaphysalis longicornis TaxID=44386 RepID=A0A9J6G3Y8_HAELO|nr:hypothetical protein HPB48_003092 [Haemaphysalis longicornis]